MAKIDRRKEAKGQECMVRIPGVCNHNPETTVLAHYRIAGYCGSSLKPDDDLGAWSCSSCHDVIDARVRLPEDWSRDAINLMHAEAVMRTWMARKK